MQRFTNLLAEGLSQKGISVRVWLPPVFVGKLGAKGYGFRKWIGYIDKYLLAPISLKKAIRKLNKRSIVHICDHSNAIYTRYLAEQPHLVTCHDLFAVRSALGEIPQNPLSKSGQQQQAMILRGLQRSQFIASVSMATQADVQRVLGKKKEWSTVVPNALDASFIQAAGTERRQLQQDYPHPLKHLSEQELFVHIGGEKWYKNRSAVLRLFSAIQKQKPEAQLVIVGTPFSNEQLNTNSCRELESKIHYLEGISDQTLRGLYSHATALLFPSRIEGFGWPILEAQACGCPVATLDRAPMNELNAKPELCLSTECDSKGWAEQSAKKITDTLYSESSLIEPAQLQSFSAQFTNEAAITAYLELYDSILDDGGLGK